MLTRLLRLSWIQAVILYLLLDILCVGAGMGVPIFCILLGLPVGWYAARKFTASETGMRTLLGQIFRTGLITSGITLVGMAIIWGRAATLLLDTRASLANFGHPMLLYEPRPSFIAWIMLMVLISPFLQLLMTLLGAHWTLLQILKK